MFVSEKSDVCVGKHMFQTKTQNRIAQVIYKKKNFHFGRFYIFENFRSSLNWENFEPNLY